MADIQVHGKAGRLTIGGNTYRCTVGSGGVVNADAKKEGDGATPAGSYSLRRVYYRPDRLDTPEAVLPLRALTPTDGWSDDPRDSKYYNHLVKLPYAGSHEKMWRDDHLYDIVVEIGYNDDPVVPGKGSAIFIHVADENYSPTAGCVALESSDLREVLKQLGPATKIVIKK